MNLLMLGQDDSVFREVPGGSNTRQRLSHYLEALRQAEPGSHMIVLIFTQARHPAIETQEGLWLIPVRASRILFFPVSGFLTAFRLRRRLHPDLVSAQSPFEAGWLGMMLSRFFHAPLEVQVHFNLLSPYLLSEHPLWNRVRLGLARRILRQAASVRVVSSPIKKELVRSWGLNEAKIAILPIPDFFAEPAGSGDQAPLPGIPGDFILFVGRLSREKNLPGLFTILEKVSAACPETVFLLVGDGPQRGYVETRLAEFSPEKVRFLGEIPHADLPAYYRRARALILPSLHEGFGRVVLESYHFATPVVATRCSGPEDIILDGETGFLTPVEDLEAFARRVIWLLKRPHEAAEMGLLGQAYVAARFDPEILTHQMVVRWQLAAARERGQG